MQPCPHSMCLGLPTLILRPRVVLLLTTGRDISHSISSSPGGQMVLVVVAVVRLAALVLVLAAIRLLVVRPHLDRQASQ